MTTSRLSLNAEERTIIGKKVKTLRAKGIIPGHVFGKGQESESVSMKHSELMPILHEAGETGLIDLKIGAEKVRTVMVRGISHDPVKGKIENVDFYQVNLKQKVTVPIPLVLIEPEEPIESVKLGEAMVLQTLSEVSVEALPTDLVDQIEVDTRPLQNIDDAITVGQLSYDREKLTVLADPDEIVVKIAAVIIEAEPIPVLVEGEEGAVVAEGEEGVDGEAGEDKEEGSEAPDDKQSLRDESLKQRLRSEDLKKEESKEE